ncbi:MAG: YjfB family protein [Fibromonadales bacterium]|nr:YjfB family protein [Fibromonadales bacterium]
METSIAELATVNKAAETSLAVDVALLKQAQQVGEAQALALIDSIPQQAPSMGALGNTVDISI